MESPPRILAHAALEQPADRCGCLGRQLTPVRFMLEDPRDRVADGGAVERAAARQHLEQHAAERPDVSDAKHVIRRGIFGFGGAAEVDENMTIEGRL